MICLINSSIRCEDSLLVPIAYVQGVLDLIAGLVCVALFFTPIFRKLLVVHRIALMSATAGVIASGCRILTFATTGGQVSLDDFDAPLVFWTLDMGVVMLAIGLAQHAWRSRSEQPAVAAKKPVAKKPAAKKAAAKKTRVKA